MGIKPVCKGILKHNKRGVVVLAGDVRQVDVIAHVPILCEEREIPYLWVPHKRDICGEQTRFSHKNVPTCLMILMDNLNDETKDKLTSLVKRMKKLSDA